MNVDQIRALASRIPEQLGDIKTEEATKNAFIMPFLSALGYNVFDPTEVIPEFTADVGGKKGEKVDYAIMLEGEPAVLIECKKAGNDLDDADTSQLFRYFTSTDVHLGILTDGITYRFFSDLDQPNRMDAKPFLEIVLTDLNESLIPELAKFSKGSFDLDEMLKAASRLKYTNEIKRVLAQQLQDPSEEFVRLFVEEVYEGRMTQTVRDRFTHLTRQAFHEFIHDRIEDRLRSAMAREMEAVDPDAPQATESEPGQRTIETTIEETEGFLTVKAIIRDTVDVGRVHMRDTMSYCGILLDDNNRKPICRLRFNGPQKYLGLFDRDKNEERVPIQSLDDIYDHSDKLKATAIAYGDA